MLLGAADFNNNRSCIVHVSSVSVGLVVLLAFLQKLPPVCVKSTKEKWPCKKPPPQPSIRIISQQQLESSSEKSPMGNIRKDGETDTRHKSSGYHIKWANASLRI